MSSQSQVRWSDHLGQVSPSWSQSPASVADDIDPASLQKSLTLDNLLPGVSTSTNQTRVGLWIAKRTTKFLDEAANQCSKPAKEVRALLTRMHSKYHAGRNGVDDSMHEHVAVCFEAASALAVLAEELEAFAHAVQRDVVGPMLEVYTRGENVLEQVVEVKNAACKEVIQERVAIAKQRALCLNQWEKLRGGLIALNEIPASMDAGDQQQQQQLPSSQSNKFGSVMRMKGKISGIVAKKSGKKLDPMFFEQEYVKTQESFKSLEDMVAQSNAKEKELRVKKVPAMLNNLQELESKRLESVEVNICKFVSLMGSFSSQVSNLSSKLGEKLTAIDRFKVMDEWTKKHGENIRPNAHTADKVLVGLPCTSSDFVLQGLDTRKPSPYMQELLKDSFQELVVSRETKSHMEEHYFHKEIKDSKNLVVKHVLKFHKQVPELKIIRVAPRDVVKVTKGDPVSLSGTLDSEDLSSFRWVRGYIVGVPNGEEGYIRLDYLGTFFADDHIEFCHIFEIPLGLHLFEDFMKKYNLDMKILKHFIGLREAIAKEQTIEASTENFLSDKSNVFEYVKANLSAEWQRIHTDRNFSSESKSIDNQASNQINDQMKNWSDILSLQKSMASYLIEEFKKFKKSSYFDSFLKQMQIIQHESLSSSGFVQKLKEAAASAESRKSSIPIDPAANLRYSEEYDDPEPQESEGKRSPNDDSISFGTMDREDLSGILHTTHE
jgi:hypothetical protein